MLRKGSRSRRLWESPPVYPLKGTNVDRVYVGFCARADLRFFTIRQKLIHGGGAFAEGNSASLKQMPAAAMNALLSERHASLEETQ